MPRRGDNRRADATARDDSQMSRFDRWGLRRFKARQAVGAVLLAAVLVVLLAGQAIRKQGEEMNPGIGRDIVLAIGRPAGWVADRLPFHDVETAATGWLASSSENLSGTGPGFARLPGRAGTPGGVLPITPQQFNPAALGEKVQRRPLGTLLVTGDSLSTPMDIEIARDLAGSGVDVIRDPHLGTGISKPALADWGKLAVAQIRADHPDAVVVFIGANEGYPMAGPNGKKVSCCGPHWAAIFAGRVRQMMNTYRQGTHARIYWLTVPAPRDSVRVPIERAVNAAVKVAAEQWASQVRVIDTVPVFTPGNQYRDAMKIDGRETIVRESDGIHLNEAGSSLAAKLVERALGRDWRW